jgi:predicted ribosome quality control (RQC) complex YloA/Tae2 family protein
VAAELDARLAGRFAHPAPRFDRDRSATLLLDRGEALRFDLHPAAGWVRIVPRPAGAEAFAPTARIARVLAAPDERLLRLELREGNRFRGGNRTLVVELHTNQWNALLVDAADRRIVSLLRTREAGQRTLRSGAVYAPPAGEPRFGARKSTTREEAWSFWEATLAPVAPAERGPAFLRCFADASPVNARSILGSAAESEAPHELLKAFERWWALHTLQGPFPVVLRTARGSQPYPAPLDGVAYDAAASLLDAMSALARAAELAEPPAAESKDAERLLALARKRAAAAERRVARLEKELEGVGEAARIRTVADHLLAYLHFVPEGAASARLPGFEDGMEIEIALDPALKPVENARRMYDEAGRRERADQRLPELLEQARHEHTRWTEAVRLAEGGELPPWAARALAKESTATRPTTSSAPRVPYRLYRTSGGLEVRVGRTSRDNDRLTFGHSHPDDVWLHARSVPGSHVILRWREADAPPARDLDEAAVLAAVFSKARSSGTVAVDWTRRKHVRKPRGAPPGSVTLLQARTVFVEPDPAVEERLRAGPGDVGTAE